MFTVRLIQPQDNPAVASIIQTVLPEFGCVGAGYASGDAETLVMYEAYQAEDARYWVVEETATGAVIGGCGFSRLKGTTAEDAVCELQKLYLLPKARGHGLGRQLLAISIAEARQCGYKTMYLETVSAMQTAIGMYQRHGFQAIPQHMGNTGHAPRCNIYMALDLTATNEASQPELVTTSA
jgi:putative acetyltransferase